MSVRYLVFAFLVCASACGGASESGDPDSGRGGSGAGQGGGAASGAGGSAGSAGATGLGGARAGMGGDVATGGAGLAGGGGSAGDACNDLDPLAWPAMSARLDSAGTPPSPAGGNLAAGTYVGTEVVVYSNQAACAGIAESVYSTLHYVVRVHPAGIASGSLELAATVAESSVTGTLSYTLLGSLMMTTGVCGVEDASEVSYTATPDELVLFSDATSDCSPVVFAFTRQ